MIIQVLYLIAYLITEFLNYILMYHLVFQIPFQQNRRKLLSGVTVLLILHFVIGFICGIISQDHDLEEMYLDSFLTIASLDDEGDITKAIEKLDIISEKFKVKFILSVSRNIDKLPECAKAKVIISL